MTSNDWAEHHVRIKAYWWNWFCEWLFWRLPVYWFTFWYLRDIVPKNPSVLDLGGGTGRVTYWLLKLLRGKGFATLIDYCEYAVGEARLFLARKRVSKKIKCLVGDIFHSNTVGRERVNLVFSSGIAGYYDLEQALDFHMRLVRSEDGCAVLVMARESAIYWKSRGERMETSGDWIYGEVPVREEDVVSYARQRKCQFLIKRIAFGGAMIVLLHR